MLVLADLIINGCKESYLFTSCDPYYRMTDNPTTVILSEVFLGLSGKTYDEKKESAIVVADEYKESLSAGNHDGLTWAECKKVTNWFENVGKRYGLMREFQKEGLI